MSGRTGMALVLAGVWGAHGFAPEPGHPFADAGSGTCH